MVTRFFRLMQLNFILYELIIIIIFIIIIIIIVIIIFVIVVVIVVFIIPSHSPTGTVTV